MHPLIPCQDISFSLVAHFSVVGFGGCGCLHWVVCALPAEGSLAPEDDNCEGPLLILVLCTLDGVEETWLVCWLWCLLELEEEAIVGESHCWRVGWCKGGG